MVELVVFLVLVRHPCGSYIVTPLLSLQVATNQLIRRCHAYAGKSASQAVFSRMQLI